MAVRHFFHNRRLRGSNEDLNTLVKSIIVECTSYDGSWKRLRPPIHLFDPFVYLDKALYESLGYHQIHNSASKGDIRDVRNLIWRGIPVDTRDAYGNTPFQIALANGHYDLMHELLELGANVNVQDDEGLTALHFAVLTGDLTKVWELLNLGSDTNIQDYERAETPLNRLAYWAVGKHEEAFICQGLISSGANLEIPDIDGRTPLINATRNPYGCFLFTVLHAAGAQTDVVDIRGMTILHHAAIRGAKDIVHFPEGYLDEKKFQALRTAKITMNPSQGDFYGLTAFKYMHMLRGELILCPSSHAHEAYSYMEAEFAGVIQTVSQRRKTLLDSIYHKHPTFATREADSTVLPSMVAEITQETARLVIAQLALVLLECESLKSVLETTLTDCLIGFRRFRAHIYQRLEAFSQRLMLEAKTLTQDFIARSFQMNIRAICMVLELEMRKRVGHERDFLDFVDVADDSDQGQHPDGLSLNKPTGFHFRMNLDRVFKSKKCRKFVLYSAAMKIMVEDLHSSLNTPFLDAAMRLASKVVKTCLFDTHDLERRMRSIISELDHTKPKDLALDYTMAPGWSDIAKIWVEKRSNMVWDWSPFDQPLCELGRNYARMYWICVSIFVQQRPSP